MLMFLQSLAMSRALFEYSRLIHCSCDGDGVGMLGLSVPLMMVPPPALHAVKHHCKN